MFQPDTIDKINNSNEELMIDEYEVKCKQDFKNNSIKQRLGKLIEDANSFLNKKLEYLKEYTHDVRSKHLC